MTKNVQDKGKPTIIQTDKGKVRCSQFDTHLEALGIPYAAPPMGDLRFRAPIEHAAWTDVRDATHFASVSLQAKTQYDRAQGSEDCLYLNVYKPAAANDGSPLTYSDVRPGQARQSMAASGAPAWMVEAELEAIAVFKAGYAAEISPIVEEVTHRKPISFDQFLQDYAAAFR